MFKKVKLSNQGIKKYQLILLALLFSMNCLAEEIYPTKPPIRPNGMDQLEVGSCQAESETTAMEYYFAERGLPVKLSTFYRHITTWGTMSDEKYDSKDPKDDQRQDMTPEDHRFRRAAAPIAPHYMWPEDSQGVQRDTTGRRPSPLSVIAMDPEYPKHSNAFGYNEVTFTFERPKNGKIRNEGTLEHLKKQVKARNAVVLFMHGSLFKQFDHYTGLLTDQYSKKTLVQDLKGADKKPFNAGTFHSIAVVGYDDNFYTGHNYPAGPGAFIIRNSWNDPDRIALVKKDIPAKRNLLKKMRLKVAKKNLPGFYAIPYQYVVDLMNAAPFRDAELRIDNRSGVGGYGVHLIDEYSFYSTYARLAGKYEVYQVPFICDRFFLDFAASHSKDFLARLRNNPETAQSFLDGVLTDTLDRDTNHFCKKDPENVDVVKNQQCSKFYGGYRVPKYEELKVRWAKLSVNQSIGINRVNDFLEGQYDSYYCNDTSGQSKYPNISEFYDVEHNVYLQDMKVEPTYGHVYSFYKLLSSIGGE